MSKYLLSRREFLIRFGLLTGGTVLTACAGLPATPTPAPSAGATAAAVPKPAAPDVMPGVPRTEVLILENPNGRIVPADDFNRWRPGTTIPASGLQQVALDALWYIDPDQGVDGVWDNALAAEKPIYNKDFTEMTVKLRKGIYWSDGVEFTADDLIYTVDTHKKTAGMTYTGQFQANVDSMTKPDNYTVVFKLLKQNSRFHAYFTVRWGACFLMPKHVFEKQADPLAFKFNPPVSLGAYTLKDFDPQGDWYLWQRREDWQRTTVAKFGMPGPKYAMYINPGPTDKKVIAQTSKQLDVIHDMAPEGMITLAKTNPNSKGWFKSFPWGHPDPTLPAVILNHGRPPYDMKEVRWALTLAIDIVRVAMASYRGAATISALHVPPTGLYPKYYFDPLEGWLKDFTLDVGGTPYKPWDPTPPQRIADEARKSLGNLVPTDATEIRKSIGMGWWKYDVATAEKLLLSKGFKRDSNKKWLLPSGQQWKIGLVCEGDTRPVMNRAAAQIAENWTEFGIDSFADVRDAATRARLPLIGDFDALLGWNIETWGGHPDLFYFLETWHSKYFKPVGENSVGKNFMRWKNPELDKIIDGIVQLDFDDPKALELGVQFVKLGVQEQPTIPIMSYNVMVCMDQTYWTGYPDSEHPYTDPVPNWGNTKYMFPKIKPKSGA